MREETIELIKEFAEGVRPLLEGMESPPNGDYHNQYLSILSDLQHIVPNSRFDSIMVVASILLEAGANKQNVESALASLGIVASKVH